MGGVGDHTILVRVADNGLPPLSQTLPLHVTVHPPPAFARIGAQSGSPLQVSFTWSAVPGARYRIEETDNFETPVWNVVAAEVVATGPTASYDLPLETMSQRFYRIVVLP